MPGASQTKYLKIGITTVVLYLFHSITDRLSWYIALRFNYSSVDKDGLFLQVSVHHILQMIFALIIILVLKKIKRIDSFKLTPKYDKKGIKYTVIFCALILAYYLTVYIIGYFDHSLGTYNYELNRVNVIGTLGFQLLLSGPSEEILFRSLPIALYQHIQRSDKKSDLALTVLLSSFLFAAAHINVNNFSWIGVCYAFVLGLVYGYTFIRSESVVYPMIIHSISNVISVGGCYLYMLIK